MILFIEIRNFLNSSKINLPDLSLSADWPKIIIGFFEFLIFSDNSLLFSKTSLIVSVLLSNILYG